MLHYIDSHAHYWDERFEGAYGKERVDQEINTLFTDKGLLAIINVGTSPDTSRLALNQSKRHKNMFAAVGIHPTDAQYIADLPKALCEIERLISENHVVAIGEIGLDYHYDDTMRSLQKFVFEEQLKMAKKHRMPVIVHDRDAHGDCLDTVSRHRGVRGVFHSYSGSLEMAKELIRHGWYISFSGTITFKNATRIASVAAELPHDKVLLETDCPYLAPHPYRGQLNHSGMVPLIVEKLAELWGMSPNECARITSENTCRLFSLSDAGLLL